MSDFICGNYKCPNRSSFGYCSLTACNQCSQVRWTDKLSIDSDGNIRDFYGNVVGHYEVPVAQDDHIRWKYDEEQKCIVCPECGKPRYDYHYGTYCANCGARMRYDRF